MNPAHAWHYDPGTAARPQFLDAEQGKGDREIAGACRLPDGALGLQLRAKTLSQWEGRRLAAWIERNFGPGSFLCVKGELVPLTDEVAARLRALAQKVV